jgi:hypothetical protein
MKNRFAISYLGDLDTDSLTGGNDVVLYGFTPLPVPEPAALLPTALACLALLARRFRSRRERKAM